jgi:hypothetical protein
MANSGPILDSGTRSAFPSRIWLGDELILAENVIRRALCSFPCGTISPKGRSSYRASITVAARCGLASRHGEIILLDEDELPRSTTCLQEWRLKLLMQCDILRSN